MARVVLDRLAKRYGNVAALEHLDLEVQDGEFLTLLGPSGCGKTTTLRLVAGFLHPTEGRVLLDDQDVSRIPPQKRDIGMVFQDYALFPHLTVGQNVGFGLRERSVPRSRVRDRVRELLRLVELPDLEDRYPAELSGGQQQRVALARAVAHPPRVLLMDEPLGALDLKLREAMQLELRRIQRELSITTIYVTHDQTEAMSLSDRIGVMSGGRLVQVGTAEEIYDRPRTEFVARFVGKVNILPARRVGDNGRWTLVEAAGTVLRVPRNASARADGDVRIAIRPERLRFASAERDLTGENALRGTIMARRFIGNLTHVLVRLDAGDVLTVETGASGTPAGNGDRVCLTWTPEEVAVLEDET